MMSRMMKISDRGETSNPLYNCFGIPVLNEKSV